MIYRSRDFKLTGGAEVVWARSGGELFYRQDNRMMAVTVETSPEFRAGTPEELFEKPFAVSNRAFGYSRYDVSRDGQRFLMVAPDQDPDSSQLRLVLNWFEELESLAPASR